MEEKVPATFVLILPYAYQNNKKIEFVAQHGSLLFAVIFFVYMTLCYLNNTINLCLLFLPQVLFYSSTYIIGCFSDNTTFQCIQILISCIFAPYSFSLVHFVTPELKYMITLLGLTYLPMCIYPIFLHFVYRKHYVKDLSTAESVSRLNIVDSCFSLLLMICFCSAVPLTELVKFCFPFGLDGTYNIHHQVSILAYYFLLGLNILMSVCGLYLVGNVGALYYYVTSCNRSKTMATPSEVVYDCYGRAWVPVLSFVERSGECETARSSKASFETSCRDHSRMQCKLIKQCFV